MEIDPRILDLIDREMDACLSAREQADLQEHLARDPAARQHLAKMKRTASLLEQAEPIEPPPDLASGVLEAVRRAPRRVRPTPAQRLREWWPGGAAALRYGYAFAAGLGAGLLVYAWSLDRLAGTHPAEPGAVAGTMAPQEPASGGALLEEIPLVFEGVTGTARLTRTLTGASLLLECESTQTLSVALEFDPPAVGIEGLDRLSHGIENLTLTRSEIRWSQQGRGTIAVHLATLTPGEATLELRFYVADRMVHRTRLALPGAG